MINSYTIGNKGNWEGNAKNTRQFINGVFWILRTGAPWRDLPSEYGLWKNVHRRFCRWRDKGVWKNILSALIDDAPFEWLLIDASHVIVKQLEKPGAKRSQKTSEKEEFCVNIV